MSGRSAEKIIGGIFYGVPADIYDRIVGLIFVEFFARMSQGVPGGNLGDIIILKIIFQYNDCKNLCRHFWKNTREVTEGIP